MKKKTNWGIIGAGRISRAFANDLKLLPDAELIAVASKSSESAKAFAGEYSLKYYYDSYEEFVKNPEIDVVYIGTTHNFHYENMLLCIKHNKSILCEKPFTVNSREAREVIEAAKDKKVFVMEAMWSRFAPAYMKVRELIDTGQIGKIKFLSADFGFRAPDDPEHRAFNPNLAGGSLLDVGIYPVSLAFWIFRKTPEKILTNANIGKTGVDNEATMVFCYDDGAVANLYSAVTVKTTHEAYIVGELGTIQIHAPFFNSRKVTLKLENRKEEFCFDFQGIGYRYEAEYVMKALRGEPCDPMIMSLNESLDIMSVLDELRKEWNLVYPFEKKY